jgi:hypothetical protein
MLLTGGPAEVSVALGFVSGKEALMRQTCWIVLVLAAAMALGGCNGAVAMSRDGRGIIGESACFSSARLLAGPQSTAVTLGGKTVNVEGSQLTWGEGETLPLQPEWHRLKLTESSSGSILVNVDGTTVARIYPKA